MSRWTESLGFVRLTCVGCLFGGMFLITTKTVQIDANLASYYPIVAAFVVCAVAIRLLTPRAITIQSLHVYPIKSCGGVSVQSVQLDRLGIVHDRRFAVVDATTHRVVSQREEPTMVREWWQCI
jgi:hypothetical protein